MQLTQVWCENFKPPGREHVVFDISGFGNHWFKVFLMKLCSIKCQCVPLCKETSRGMCAETIHHVSYLTVTICPLSREMSFIWAIKMAATASYSAVPSILMVAPMGSTKRVTRLSIFRFSSRQRKVTGNVPALRTEGLKRWVNYRTKRKVQMYKEQEQSFCWR